MVAFLAFSAGLQAPGAGFPWNLAAIAAVVNLVAVPSSILGNEAALRMGRGRWILIAMVVFILVLLILLPLLFLASYFFPKVKINKKFVKFNNK